MAWTMTLAGSPLAISLSLTASAKLLKIDLRTLKTTKTLQLKTNRIIKRKKKSIQISNIVREITIKNTYLNLDEH